ncbi:MAG TPA: stage II sporulation protein R [Firmicutes bacterium]|nr:stage II sporulation protein R [Bacillota bacterium]
MKKIELSLLAGLIISILLSSVGTFAADCEEIRDHMLRLHILANSDSTEDQHLKMLVRDAVVETAGQFSETADTDREDLLREIEETAEHTLRINGSSHAVRAEYTKMYFEARQYGDYTLPAGEYNTVQIKIGEAAGQNWWCVLYPPLCLPAASGPAILEEELTEEEIQILESPEKYEVRFLLVDWLDTICQKLLG